MNPCVGTRLGVPRDRSVARRELKRDFESRQHRGTAAECNFSALGTTCTKVQNVTPGALLYGTHLRQQPPSERLPYARRSPSLPRKGV